MHMLVTYMYIYTHTIYTRQCYEYERLSFIQRSERSVTVAARSKALSYVSDHKRATLMT
jgi:hypothetical protein